MAEIILLMLPIFSLIGFGALFVWRGWFPAAELPVLNRLVMNACLPVLLFSAVIKGESLAGFAWGHALVYAGASLVSALILWGALRFVLKAAQPQAVILSLGGGVSNSVFLGFPIAQVIIPDRAAEIVSWVVLAEIAFIIPVITSIALWAQQQGGTVSARSILLPLLQSPVTIGLAAGFVFLASGVSLSGWMQQVVGSIVAAAPFIALFIIGGMLINSPVTRTGPRVIGVTLAKLALHPLCVGLGFGLIFGWDTTVLRDAVLFASIPVFATYVVFAGRHQVGDVAASAVVVTTLIGAVSVPLMLSWLY